MTKEEVAVKYFLIVDDLLGQRRAIKKSIQEAMPRSEFIQAASLSEAIEIVKGKEPIDIAVVDLKLTPDGKEGVEIIKTIKDEAHRKKVRTILITAYPREMSEVIANKAEVDRYICKLDTSSLTVELQMAVKELLGL